MGTRILTNAKIITVDDQFSVQQAVAFPNGRITAVGANNDVLAAARPGAEVADLGGATVIPTVARRGELTMRVFTTLGDASNAATLEQAGAMADRVRGSRPFQGDHWHDRIAVGEVYYAPFHWDHPTVPPSPSDRDVAAADEILRAAAESGRSGRACGRTSWSWTGTT